MPTSGTWSATARPGCGGGRTPVEVFLDTTEFHVPAAQRRQPHGFGGRRIPFLGCSDLAVLKAFFDRTRDWADLGEVIAIGALDVDQTLRFLVRYLGEGDDRVARLPTLTVPEGRPGPHGHAWRSRTPAHTRAPWARTVQASVRRRPAG